MLNILNSQQLLSVSISTHLANISLSSSDYALVEAVQLYSKVGTRKQIDWEKVQKYVKGNKSREQLNHHWKHYLKPKLSGIIYDKWTAEEVTYSTFAWCDA